MSNFHDDTVQQLAARSRRLREIADSLYRQADAFDAQIEKVLREAGEKFEFGGPDKRKGHSSSTS